ncbi:MAG: TIGR04168 family protein [Gloeomargaritaceae cyanobacterium C42_A2020_066]|nr:TIGR04168 family protein [Gloeomargaritaceae cyanobacterium C42_A2020_066]
MRTPSPPPVHAAGRPVTLAVIGDVHDQWTADDPHILAALGVDGMLFVGDFGNEAVPVVAAIASLLLPKAVVLGNHDAWFTATEWGRAKCPYDRAREDRLLAQLAYLGADHVGYGYRNFPTLGLSVVGGRPCSWGGSDWRHGSFYQQYFGVDSLATSAERIDEAARQATGETLVFLNHNGPLGLGDAPQSPCGRDWNPIGADFGDPDLAIALAHTRQRGRPAALVVFGHMHRQLRQNLGQRQMLLVDAMGTVYLNAAVVPRIRLGPTGPEHHMALVTLAAGRVTEARFVWCSPQGRILTEETLYTRPAEAAADWRTEVLATG